MPGGDGWLELAARRAGLRSGRRHGTVEAARACERCGYNLKGLRWPGRCPECGSPFGLGGHAEEEGPLPWPNAGALAALSMGLGLLLVGGGLVLGALALPAFFDVVPSVAPVDDSRAWWIVLFLLVVLGGPGAVVWLIGAALVGAPGTPNDEGGPPAASNAFEARPSWPRYVTWASAAGLLLAVACMTVALWPGLGLSESLEVPARLALVLGSAGVWPISLILSDVADRLDEPGLGEKLMMWGYLLAGGAAGAALGSMPARYLGCMGSLISGVAWMAGLFVVPAGVGWLWTLARLRGPMNWAKGVAAVTEAAAKSKPAPRRARTEARQG